MVKSPLMCRTRRDLLVSHWSPWPLFSIPHLAHSLAQLAMTVATVDCKVVHLDMAHNSFDDQYINCGPAMTATLPALKRSDFQKNPLFAQTWAKATAEWQKQGSDSFSLTKDQAIALMVYTMNDMFKKFNKAVREAGRSCQEYQYNFHFKTLHFLLTQALQKLRCPNKCLDVSRGVRNTQFNVKFGDNVRLNQFTSSSMNKSVAEYYGTDTMFEVHTCRGAHIEKFSFNQSEKELLIPPFENFQVAKVTREGKKLQIEHRSTGNSSNHNCEWLRGDILGTTWGDGGTQWEPHQELPPSWGASPGHRGHGSGHWNPLSLEATKVAVVVEATVEGHQDEGHQDKGHQDPQRNGATKASEAIMTTVALLSTVTTVVVIVTMASVATLASMTTRATLGIGTTIVSMAIVLTVTQNVTMHTVTTVFAATTETTSDTTASKATKVTVATTATVATMVTLPSGLGDYTDHGVQIACDGCSDLMAAIAAKVARVAVVAMVAFVVSFL
ncbi:NAD(P)(+)--arginine ADP-ribosyltransferase 2-like [Melospiza georgiana]|uniref:NAD(P)(+)--arginine ADP-ribosyltransferase 2-like n=1 Tax=Melospiza georgiana TaxID=44398 RepID=UPI0025AC7FF3|nr:NAD(P)(+)--arginine ADP-ribosyltransferase 2-like [Melospiza georgiana]